jgi:hypothetical protein
MRDASGEPPGDDAIQAVVARLARPHRSGGSVIERAAILAEGDRSAAILAWVVGHAGEPEIAPSQEPHRGLYGTGFGGGVTAPRGPSRYVLPAGALRSGPAGAEREDLEWNP